jgi:hypothetical protein
LILVHDAEIIGVATVDYIVIVFFVRCVRVGLAVHEVAEGDVARRG